MTKLLIPGLTTVLNALARHKKLRLMNCLIGWAHAITH
nr:MAG TPA: Protein of unknown function (DUF2785) [Caudoviricetes sp.]